MLHPSKALRAAALLGMASLALAGCSFISSGDAKRDESGKPTETSVADAFKIKVGDCIAEPSGTEVKDVSIIPCDQSHDLEAYAAKNIVADAYPGQSAVEAQSEEFCSTEFGTFVGVPYDESTLELTYFYPTTETWKASDREIVCLIGGASGTATTGTLKAAAK
ncbi:septum formation family protein [Paenarthrobacter sp. NPDC056912]|uniref:septum formation family protein n=1 Tax=Paenarthrobacter sp. NPDC056912 TaxID=3345965 RepID=UPI00366CFFBA